MLRTPGEDTADAARWWQARVLAENDQAGELRERATAGDEHARRQLASLLSDHNSMEEAIEVIYPLADAGDDVAELRLARWLADDDRLDELRQRAGGGEHALRELARRLAQRDMHAELRDLASAADEDGRQVILRGAGQVGSGSTAVLRARVDLGDDSARSALARRLAREGHLDELRERAEKGDRYAQHRLAEAEGVRVDDCDPGRAGGRDGRGGPS
jgi:hypothetical protein